MAASACVSFARFFCLLCRSMILEMLDVDVTNLERKVNKYVSVIYDAWQYYFICLNLQNRDGRQLLLVEVIRKCNGSGSRSFMQKLKEQKSLFSAIALYEVTKNLNHTVQRLIFSNNGVTMDPAKFEVKAVADSLLDMSTVPACRSFIYSFCVSVQCQLFLPAMRYFHKKVYL